MYSIREVKVMEHRMGTMATQIEDQETLIEQLKAKLAAAANLDSKPRSQGWLSLPTLLSLRCVITAGIVLYLFLAIEPPAVKPF